MDETSNHGGLSGDAAVAFHWLARMLQDTLRYVSQNMQEAWAKQNADNNRLQQSIFFKALQEPAGSDKYHVYSVVASCLNISHTDIEAFIATTEGQPDNAAEVQEGRC